MMTQQQKDLKKSKAIRSRVKARAFAKRETYARLNVRRGDLVHIKVYGTLTPEQEVEYEVLQKEIGRLINLAYPRPSFDRKTKRLLKGLAERYPDDKNIQALLNLESKGKHANKS